MAFVGLTSFLEERGAQDAESILLEAGVERVEDLEPLLNPEDLRNLGLSRHLSSLVLGVELEEPTDAASSATVAAPSAAPFLRRLTASDLNLWLMRHDLAAAEQTLEEVLF